MRETIRILRKDVRHAWPQLGGWLALLAAYAVADALLPRHPQIQFASLMIAVPLAVGAFFLVATAVFEEALPGDRQYWPTRPYHWRSLLAAKLLFVVLFFHLPLLVSEITALLVNGESLTANASVILDRQLAFAFCMLGVVAVAVITRNLVQFTLVLLGAVAWLFLETSALVAWLHGSPDLGVPEWVRDDTMLVLCAAFVAVILVLQYARRRTLPSRLSACGFLALLPMSQTLFPWPDWAFRMESRDVPGVRISFDPTRPSRAVPMTWWPEERSVVIGVPVRVDGIPSNQAVLAERVQVRIAAPGGRSWQSKWRPGGMSLYSEPTSGQQPVAAKLIEGDRPDQILAANVDLAFFDTVKNLPVTLRVSLALSLMSAGETSRLPIPAAVRRLPGAGLCSVTVARGFVAVPCFTARKPDWSEIRLVSLRSGEPGQPYTWSQGLFSVWASTGGAGYTPPPAPADVVIRTRERICVFERTLEIHAIRLAAYEVGRTPRFMVGTK